MHDYWNAAEAYMPLSGPYGSDVYVVTACKILKALLGF
jgi:hypothetical protein